jgi:hypothetical protein
MNPKKRKSKTRTKTTAEAPLPESLRRVNLHAAGIDIGSTEHWVAVPPGSDQKPVRCFSTFTADLHALADWLAACKVSTVAMESTGVYWIALFQILETRGFEVLLVNARHVKNVPGRKSDVLAASGCRSCKPSGCYAAASGPRMRSASCGPTGGIATI